MSEIVSPKQVRLMSAPQRETIFVLPPSDHQAKTVPPKRKITPQFSKNALRVIEKRYLLKDRHRQPIETPEEMLHRVAKHIAQGDKLFGESEAEIEKSGNDFYNLMPKLEFLPNSPAFTGAGTKLGQLAACFVLPIEDSMEGIFEAIKNTALIHKSGGGTGFSFSRLRPKDDIVSSTKGVSS